MKLIEEIIEILSSEDGKLSTALLKTKVLLHKIGHKELVPWVSSELDGYKTGETVPEYRIIRTELKGNFANLAYQYTSHPIPTYHLSPDIRAKFETTKMVQALTVLEEFSISDERRVRSPWPAHTYAALGKGLDPSFHISQAWSEIGSTSVMQIITIVRSRLLDFMLEISDELTDELNDIQAREKVSSLPIADIFRDTVNNGTITIAIGGNNAQATSNIGSKGDFEALAKILSENNVSSVDIKSLEQAVSDDKEVVDHGKETYGPKVQGWLKSMLSKAVDAAWKIEISVASSVLTEGLKRFYGWL